MQRADEQTWMVMDNTTWGMRPEAFEQVTTDLEIPATDIQLDVLSQEDMKKASRWFSISNAPGSAGVDGFYQRWVYADGTRPGLLLGEQYFPSHRKNNPKLAGGRCGRHPCVP